MARARADRRLFVVILLPLVRFGLVPFMVGFGIHQLMSSTALTTDLGTWYAPPTWVVGRCCWRSR